MLKGEGSIGSDLPEPSMLDVMGQDPAAMGRMMRQMSEETGEAMPDEMNEVVHRLEKGESPDEIEKNMPDLGTDSITDDE